MSRNKFDPNNLLEKRLTSMFLNNLKLILKSHSNRSHVQINISQRVIIQVKHITHRQLVGPKLFSPSKIMILRAQSQALIIILIQMYQNGDLAIPQLSLQPYDSLVVPPFNIKQPLFRKCTNYARQGHWNQKQRLKYTIFLIFFQKLLEDDTKKKSVKIFDMMSDMIVTRNSKQCRNHHQKMQKYRNSIPGIINSIAQKYQPKVFSQITQRYSILIKTLLYNQEKYIRGPQIGQSSLKTCQGYDQTPFQMEQFPFRAQETIKTLIIPEKKQEQNCLQLLKNSYRVKQDQIKTKAEYNDNHTLYEDFSCEDIPFMRIDDFRSQEEAQSLPKIQVVSHQYISNVDDPFQNDTRFKLDKHDMKLCQSQVRKMSLQRQWHIMNIHHLSSQIIKEKESIQYCESAIKLLRMTINIIDDDSI